MRHSILKSIIAALLLVSVLFGQNLNIQGVARDNSGQSLSNGSYGFTFRLYTAESGGSSVWSEVQTLEVLNGVFSAVLGDVNSLAGIDFDAQYWLSLEIDGNGELSPRTKLIVSPYAIMASLTNQDNVVPLSGNVGIGVPQPGLKLDVAGDLRLNRDSAHDIWIQGGPGIDGTDRNLALVGFKASDQLQLNFNGEYTGGTVLGGNVGIGNGSPLFKLDVLGSARFDHSDSYDVWIQGGAGSNGDTRNLAILGEKWSDRLILNFGSEYANGTVIGGPVEVQGHLTALGDIKLGQYGEFGSVSARAGQTQIIYGAVWGNGNLEYGEGFTSTRTGAGSYQINFTYGFAGMPSVTFTKYGNEGYATDNNFIITFLDPSRVNVFLKEPGNGAGEDGRFHFQAIGPR